MRSDAQRVVRPALLLTGEKWVDIAIRSCTCHEPFFGASRSIQGLLDWTAENGNFLVREVSTELASFPEAAETLFQAIAFKKWRYAAPETAIERRREALAGFVERNRLAGALPLPCKLTREKMRRLLARWLPFQGVACPRFGPGAVAERYSHARRWQILNEWFYTPSYETMSDVEGPSVRPNLWKSGLYLHADDSVLSKHGTARLCAVPKDWNKDRLITVEPALNAFLQQAVRLSILESVHSGPLRGSAMDLYADGQAIQRRLALQGSADGSLATLDLSNASDNITAELVFDVFPPWVCTLLEQCRTAAFDDGNACHTMHIYAGMGNATTFVIETLLFTAYCQALAWRCGRKSPVVSVFGDDIVVNSELAADLLTYRDEFFKINEDKSFIGKQTKLRESCGIYALDGRDITPVRINGLLDNYQGRLGASELVDRLSRSTEPYQIRMWRALAEHLEGKLENWEFHVEGYPSMSVPFLPFSPLPPMRRHTDYQVRQAQVVLPAPAKAEIRLTKGDLWALEGSLAGVLRSERRKNGDVVSFPLRGRWTKPRKRWLNVCPSI